MAFFIETSTDTGYKNSMYLIKAEVALLAFFLALTAIAVKVSYGVLASLPFWLAFILLVFFFRNPPRKPPSNPMAIVAPIDALVAYHFTAEEPFQGEERQILRLRRRHGGIFSLFSPAEGQILQTWYGERYQRPQRQLSRDRGHICTAWIRTDEGDDMLMSFYRAFTLRYLQMRPQPGERIGQGKAIGLSTIQYIDILLPLDAEVKVAVGDTVKGGETTLGQFAHRSKKERF
ncbi:hypothetical protein GP5015_541 [gamma proteobacterium HTCC5015]|nr:hypothetical protein GP5015_541 [gamma proteobacterium HTCC5015]